MDRPNSFLIQFDSSVLDVNENPSDVDIVISNVREQRETSSTKDNSSQSFNNSDANVLFPPSSPKVFESENEYGATDLSDCLLNTDVISIRRKSDSGIHESKTDVMDGDNCSAKGILDSSQNNEHVSVDTGKLFDITNCNLNLSNGFGGLMPEISNEDGGSTSNETFHDAVQFFKDPSSFTFLENAGGPSAEPFNPRSSLFMNFDPLHANFNPQIKKQTTVLEEISENDSHLEIPDNTSDTNTQPLINKGLAAVEASRGQNLLMSFDSPAACSKGGEDSTSLENEAPKLCTEADLQQALKVQELSLQEQFIKNQKEQEDKISKLNILCSSVFQILKDVAEIAFSLSEKEKNQQEIMEQVAKENEKLKEDLKTSVEDLQSVENTFSDFHKRYEQCKSMLKVYTQNESSFKQQIENLNIQLQEKEEMYNALQVRTQEMVDKANLEVANVKKTNEGQTAVLKAQLKKAELKISSLESDVKHIKIENCKLSSICDELMAKVSES